MTDIRSLTPEERGILLARLQREAEADAHELSKQDIIFAEGRQLQAAQADLYEELAETYNYMGRLHDEFFAAQDKAADLHAKIKALSERRKAIGAELAENRTAPKRADYDIAFRKIEAGADKFEVKASFLARFPETSDAQFYSAMYRRRTLVKEGNMTSAISEKSGDGV